MCLAPCAAKSKAERIKKWKITVSAWPGEDTTGGQGCSRWWRWKTLSLLPLCQRALHPPRAGHQNGEDGKKSSFFLSATKKKKKKKLCHKGPFFVEQKAGGRWEAARGRAMPSLGSRGQVRSAAAAPRTGTAPAAAPAAPLAPASIGKGIQPLGKALPEGKRPQVSFYGCPHPKNLHSFIAQPSDRSAWLSSSCPASVKFSSSISLAVWFLSQLRTHLGGSGGDQVHGSPGLTHHWCPEVISPLSYLLAKSITLPETIQRHNN